MLRYEINHNKEYVQEVFHFLESPPKFHTGFDNNLMKDEKFVIISGKHWLDGESKLDIFQEPDTHLAKIQGYSWSDIVKMDDGHFLEFAQNNRDLMEMIYKVFDSQLNEIYQAVEKKFSAYFEEQVIDAIGSFFDNLLIYRASTGCHKSITNSMFQVYQANGFPCGWSGCYPHGEMVVYSSMQLDSTTSQNLPD